MSPRDLAQRRPRWHPRHRLIGGISAVAAQEAWRSGGTPWQGRSWPPSRRGRLSFGRGGRYGSEGRRMVWNHFADCPLEGSRADPNIHLVRAAAPVADDAKQDQTAAEHQGEHDQLTALGLEEVDEIARFHGLGSFWSNWSNAALQPLARAPRARRQSRHEHAELVLSVKARCVPRPASGDGQIDRGRRFGRGGQPDRIRLIAIW